MGTKQNCRRSSYNRKGSTHNTDQVNKASADAIASANRLLKMVRVAKGSTAKNPEEFALQIEKNELAAAQTESELKQTQATLEATKGKLEQVTARSEKLESKAWLDNEFEKIRGQFATDEAEVYKQGDKLLLRLKGLSFANNKAEISSSKFPLLAKVQKVINEMGPSQIEVEGHTDSTGSKKSNDEISTKRAESVKDYLIANQNVAPEKVTAKGYGDTKPITTNKTPEGRAQNRRVDVIIEPAIQQ
jgi:outer membrane protein OmpA-like peptidoglycan-associated protein